MDIYELEREIIARFGKKDHIELGEKKEILQKSINVAEADNKAYIIPMMVMEEIDELNHELIQIMIKYGDRLNNLSIDNKVKLSLASANPLLTVYEEIADVKITIIRLLTFIGMYQYEDGKNEIQTILCVDESTYIIDIVDAFTLISKYVSKYIRGKITEISDIYDFVCALYNALYICNYIISVFDADNIVMYIEDIKFERLNDRDNAYIESKIKDGNERFRSYFLESPLY